MINYVVSAGHFGIFFCGQFVKYSEQSVRLAKGEGIRNGIYNSGHWWSCVPSDEKVRRVLTNPPPLTVTGYHYKAQSG